MKRSTVLLISFTATAGLFVGACSSDSSSKGGSSGDFCTLARAYDLSEGELDTIFDSEPKPEDVKKAFETVTSQIDAMVAVAPDEIKADATLLQGGLKTFLDVMRDADFDITALFSDPTVAEKLAALDSEEFDTAGKNMDTYLTETCGIDTSS